MHDAAAWAEALLSVVGVDISAVDVTAVPPTDDDAVLANWQSQMHALVRTAAAIDAEDSANPGSAYAPGFDSGSDNDSDGAD